MSAYVFGSLLFVVKSAVYLLLGAAFGGRLSGYRDRPVLRGINLGLARLALGIAIGVPVVIIGPIIDDHSGKLIDLADIISIIAMVLMRMGLWFALTKVFFRSTPNARIAGFSLGAAALITLIELLTVPGAHFSFF